MKLSYRGQTYNRADVAAIKGDAANIAGTYRGVKTTFKHSQAQVSHNDNLTYRGVPYAG
ncbi:MAG: DUF4278 domain-containing protein [Cyanobacteria bacterium P01_G01_bin.54]